MSDGRPGVADLAEMEGARADAATARRRRKQRRRRRSAVVLVLALVLIGGAGYAAWSSLRGLVSSFTSAAPEDFEGPGSGEVVVQIESGDTGRAIGQVLADAGVVASVGAFVEAVQAEPAAASLQPGSYALKEGMPARDALAALLDPASRVSFVVAVPEGFTKAQVLGRVAEVTGLGIDELEVGAADAAALGLPPSAQGDPEGFLYPATYEFDPDVTAPEVLKTMVDRAKQALAEVGVPPEVEREVVIKASLVEEEAGLAEDFPKVARVIENRLAAGMPLQFDSTVNYATGSDGITTTDEQRAVDSPYNTYRYPGLPAGPISSPGEQALRAVLEPAEGDWLYFVTVDPDTGETRFTDSLAEHQQNVEIFREWLRAQD